MAFAGGGSRKRKAGRKYAHSEARRAGMVGPNYLYSETAGQIRRVIMKMKACKATTDEVATAGMKMGRIASSSMNQKVRAAYRKALTAWKGC